MVSDNLLLMLSNNPTLPLRTKHHLLNRSEQILLCDNLSVLPYGKDSCLIHYRGKISTRESRRSPCDNLKIYRIVKLLLPCMYLKDCVALLNIREINDNFSIKPTRAKQRIV